MKIYHNPRCTKSRQALALLRENDIEPEIILYLESPPTKSELSEIIELLDIEPEELIRKGEAIYKENYKGKKLTDSQWIKAMIEHPKLIERPIVVKGKHAVIGRPTSNVLDLI